MIHTAPYRAHVWPEASYPLLSSQGPRFLPPPRPDRACARQLLHNVLAARSHGWDQKARHPLRLIRWPHPRSWIRGGSAGVLRGVAGSSWRYVGQACQATNLKFFRRVENRQVRGMVNTKILSPLSTNKKLHTTHKCLRTMIQGAPAGATNQDRTPPGSQERLYAPVTAWKASRGTWRPGAPQRAREGHSEAMTSG
jgi:hypothetical protein